MCTYPHDVFLNAISQDTIMESNSIKSILFTYYAKNRNVS